MVAPVGCDQFAWSTRVFDNQSSYGLMAGLNRRLARLEPTCHQTQSGYTRACPMVGRRTSVRVISSLTLGSTRVMLGARKQYACECPPASPRATTHSHPYWHSASAIRMSLVSRALPHAKRTHSPCPWAYSGVSPGHTRVSAPQGPSLLTVATPRIPMWDRTTMALYGRSTVFLHRAPFVSSYQTTSLGRRRDRTAHEPITGPARHQALPDGNGIL